MLPHHHPDPLASDELGIGDGHRRNGGKGKHVQVVCSQCSGKTSQACRQVGAHRSRLGHGDVAGTPEARRGSAGDSAILTLTVTTCCFFLMPSPVLPRRQLQAPIRLSTHLRALAWQSESLKRGSPFTACTAIGPARQPPLCSLAVSCRHLQAYQCPLKHGPGNATPHRKNYTLSCQP